MALIEPLTAAEREAVQNALHNRNRDGSCLPRIGTLWKRVKRRADSPMGQIVVLGYAKHHRATMILFQRLDGGGTMHAQTADEFNRDGWSFQGYLLIQSDIIGDLLAAE